VIRYEPQYVASSFIVAVVLMMIGIFVADNPDNPNVRDICIGSCVSGTPISCRSI